MFLKVKYKRLHFVSKRMKVETGAQKHNTHIYTHTHTHTLTHTYTHTNAHISCAYFFIFIMESRLIKRGESNFLFKFQHSVTIRNVLNSANSNGNIPVTVERGRAVS